jgi:hypothetical protein
MRKNNLLYLLCLSILLIAISCDKKTEEADKTTDLRDAWIGLFKGKYKEIHAYHTSSFPDPLVIEYDSLTTEVVIEVSKDPNDKMGVILAFNPPGPDSLIFPDFLPKNIEVDSSGVYWKNSGDATYEQRLFLHPTEVELFWDYLYIEGSEIEFTGTKLP